MYLKTIATKLTYSFLVALPMASFTMLISPFRALLEVHASFFTILAFAIIIDLIIGIIKYLKLNKFSFKKLAIGLITKVIVSYGGMVLFLTFATLEDGGLMEWFLLIAKFTILLYPAGSAFANMFVITNGRFPPIGLMKKLEVFDQLSTPIIPAIEENIEKNGNPTKNK